MALGTATAAAATVRGPVTTGAARASVKTAKTTNTAAKVKPPARNLAAKAVATDQPARPFVLAYYLPGSGSEPSLLRNYRDIGAIAPLWFGIHSDGSVEHRSGGSLAAIVNLAHRLGRKVYVLVTNMAQDRILIDPTVRRTAVRNLVQAVLANHLDGANIDFENIDGTDAQGLVDFVAAVHAQLAPHHVVTSVAVGPRSSSNLPPGDQSDAYNYAALGRVSDYVVLMTYDEHCPPGGAGPIAALPWVRSVVDYAVSQMPAAKVLLGIAAYGYDWSQPGIPTVTAGQAISQIGRGGVRLGWSDTAEEPYYTSGTHDVWFEDSYSAALKFGVVRSLHLGGIALWYLGAEDSSFWPTVQKELFK